MKSGSGSWASESASGALLLLRPSLDAFALTAVLPPSYREWHHVTGAALGTPPALPQIRNEGVRPVLLHQLGDRPGVLICFVSSPMCRLADRIGGPVPACVVATHQNRRLRLDSISAQP